MSGFSLGTTRSTRLRRVWIRMFDPRQSCGLMLSQSVSSQDRAANLNGFEVRAPTGHRSIMLPDTSESMERFRKVLILTCSPRPGAPISITPATSSPKRTQRVQ